MNFLRITVAGIAGALAVGPAMAADPPVPAPPLAAPPVVAAPAFDWNRFYLGAQAGVWFDVGPFGFNTFRVAGQVGKNFQVGDRMVLGFDLSAGTYFYGPPLDFEVHGKGRAGFLINDRVLLFASGGLGWDGTLGAVVGGGVEAAVGDRISVVLESFGLWYFGDPSFSYVSVTAGVNFHFGR